MDFCKADDFLKFINKIINTVPCGFGNASENYRWSTIDNTDVRTLRCGFRGHAHNQPHLSFNNERMIGV